MGKELKGPRTDLEQVMAHYEISESAAKELLSKHKAEELLPSRGTATGWQSNDAVSEPMEEVEPEKAAQLLSEDGNQRGMVTLWGDKRITVCVGDEEGKGACYTSEKPEGEPLYYLAQAFYTYLGHKIKPIEV